jgi:carbon starvation protein CstA
VTSERQGRPVFFGAMIAEGGIALIWAAAALAYFGGAPNLNAALAEHGNNAGWAVSQVCTAWLGRTGGFLALLGVVACPITSGDTAFRSARLIVADLLKLPQRPIRNRLVICIPMFALGVIVSYQKFDLVWRYFAWSNQTLATVVLWAGAVFLAQKQRNHWIASLPATMMTAVCTSYILIAPEGFRIQPWLGTVLGLVAAAAVLGWFLAATRTRPATDRAANPVASRLAQERSESTQTHA